MGRNCVYIVAVRIPKVKARGTFRLSRIVAVVSTLATFATFFGFAEAPSFLGAGDAGLNKRVEVCA